MWHFFSRKKIERSRSKALTVVAERVLRYRRHLLQRADIVAIEADVAELRRAMGEGNLVEMRSGYAALGGRLEACGGDIFPQSEFTNGVETLFIAALLAVALRTFFVQSFVIPTNSMYPTYRGMTCEMVPDGGEMSLPSRLWYGATERSVIAAAAGEVEIQLAFGVDSFGKRHCLAHYAAVRSPWPYGLFGRGGRTYTLSIGGVEHSISVPADFPLDSVLLGKFFPGAKSWQDVLAGDRGGLIRGSPSLLRTGYVARAGENVLHFRIYGGDMLFVDRLTHRFRRPKVGESVIFITDKIDDLRERPKFFIKRLAGVPNDTLSIVGGKLLSNGKMSPANDWMEAANGDWKKRNGGYVAAGMLAPGLTVRVPAEHYFVLGDNSAESHDSRFWGFVPAKSVCGRPLFIFYPPGRRFCK
jgi:signal peptidase I